MTISKELLRLGLSENEVAVYLAGLEFGEASVQRLSTKAKLKRTTVYGVVHALLERGLFIVSKRKGKNVFAAADPRRFLELIEENQRTLASLLPELLAMAGATDKKPKISFFEGTRALKNIHADTLRFPEREYVTWIPAEAFSDLDMKYWSEYYLPKRLELKIHIRVIVNDVPLAHELLKEKDVNELRQTRLDKNETLNAWVILYGQDRVAFVSTKEIIAVVIESKSIYKTMKSLFEIHWRTLE